MAARRILSKRARVAPPRGGGKCKPLRAAPKWLVGAAIAILAALAFVLIYRMFAQSRQRDGFDDGASKKLPAKIVFLHMDGCGWCEKFKPQWVDFKKQYGSELASANVTAVSYERKDSAASAFGQVDGYPTILFVVEGGKQIKFQGDRTPAGLIAFVRENGYGVVEGYYAEPESEFGAIQKTVQSTKSSQDGAVKGQQKSMRSGAGGDLKSTSSSG